ncbi:MAG TPA: class I SAM-dependent methyltransferase [Chloroflexia bacterium]|nr:class I SAM-dependent methyltransferase [Chloroflexia bacterium]
MDEYREANRTLWNEWATLHVESQAYDVEGFKAGKSSLNSIELEELGDVQGKTLLHLQCHFGKDTLSWARLGATVTGADFSERAIAYARALSDEIGVPATFVLSDILDLPNALTGQFDIVFTSYGAITWLPDIRRWAEVVAHFLKPGGTFYMAEFHPFAYTFENTKEEPELRLTYPYFYSEQPLRFDTQGSYAAPDADYKGVEYSWSHSMGDIITSLASVGLRIEFLHEFPVSVNFSMFAHMEEDADGYYRLKGQKIDVPLMFSIRASKDV